MKAKPKQTILTIPNLITFIRLLIVIPIFLFLKANNNIFGLLFFIGFLVLDKVDGWIARKFRQETRFGEKFDLLADSLCGAVIFISLIIFGAIPKTILILTLMNFFVQGILMLSVIIKTKAVHNSELRPLPALVYFGFFILLLINIYNVVTLTLFYIFLVIMYLLVIHYFFEVRRIFKLKGAKGSVKKK